MRTNWAPAQKCMHNHGTLLMVFAPGAIACISHWAPTCINSWCLVERAIAYIRIGPLPQMCINNHFWVLPHMRFYACFNCVLPTIAIACIIHWAPNCMGMVEKAFACIRIRPLNKNGAYIIMLGSCRKCGFMYVLIVLCTEKQMHA